ncbi:hypothetical protein LO80_04030 [Candidatus Francisella endociliophora]|uniref:Uncharacterized protein n=1 Tax=Candidatus Francisella endociliophora TaxID=653937 RepID=A0A097ENS9_9GAMM|nr:hypothetical protein [Francisella sp. FSC1006]AIT09223.1 hypothetical protein LO80_04030 [Francisella sp. FSC1006]
MSKQVTQKLVNQKCDLLKSQNEEITVNKIRKLIGNGVSIIDLVEKVTLYKDDRKQALAVAENEVEQISKPNHDELLETIKTTLKSFAVDKNDITYTLRNNLKTHIDKEVADKTSKLKQKQVELSNRNDSLEISNLTLEKRYKELLEKFSQLKEDLHQLKQDFNNRTIKQLNKEDEEASLLDIEEFTSFSEQLRKYNKDPSVAVYDANKRTILIKFPATSALTAECRKGRSSFLNAITTFDFTNKVWELRGYNLKTVDYLKRKGFVFSRELETIVYMFKQRQAQQSNN